MFQNFVDEENAWTAANEMKMENGVGCISKCIIYMHMHVVCIISKASGRYFFFIEIIIM